MHVKAIGAALLATTAVGSVCVGCGTSTPQAVTTTTTTSPAANESASILSAVVDCGQDGAAQVRVAYGKFTKTQLVSRALAGHRPDAVPVYSENFGGVNPAPKPFDFIITTMPTSGACKTTLTNYVSGDVISQRETAGAATLRATLIGQA